MEIVKKDKMWLDDGKHLGIRRKTSQSVGDTSYRNSTTNAILPSYYGEEFEAVKNAGDLKQVTKALEGKTIRGKKAGAPLVDSRLKSAFSVVDNGFTPMSIMGKEWDKQWATHNERRLINSGISGSSVLATERKWINRAKAENSVSVKEFYDLLVADRLTKNPELMQNLATKRELEAAGFEVSKMATPIYAGNKETEGYYDLSAIAQGVIENHKAPVYADETLLEGNENLANDLEEARLRKTFVEWQEEHEKSGISYEDYVQQNGLAKMASACVDIHSLNLSVANDSVAFDYFIKNLQTVTGAKIKSAPLENGKMVSVTQNVLRSAGRRVVNYYRVKFNKRSSTLHNSYTITYNQNASREEQVYALLSQVAELSTKPFFRNTERLITKGNGFGLPSKTEFIPMRNTLLKFTTAMTTGELAKIVMMNADDAAKIEGLAYLKASQVLAGRPDLANNKNLIPLASGYTIAATNRCAAALHMILDEYEAVTGKKPFSKENNNTFLAAVFAKQDYSQLKHNKLYEPTGLAKTHMTEAEKDQKVSESFIYLQNVLEKEIAEGRAEEELATNLNTFFGWSDVVSKGAGISFEEYVKGKNASKARKAKAEATLTEDQKAQSVQMFLEWVDAYQKSGVDFESFSKEFLSKKEAESNASGELNESEEEVRRQLRGMFGEPSEKKARTKGELNESEDDVKKQLESLFTMNKESEEIVKGISKRVRDWALNLKIFKGEEEETNTYKKDVTMLGKTSTSVKGAVYEEVCDIINKVKDSSLSKDAKVRFADRRNLFPIGKKVSASDINKAKEKDSAIAEIDSIVNAEVEKVLSEAASDKNSKTMTGSQVTQKYFGEKERKNNLAKQIVEKIIAPVVPKHNKTLNEFGC